MQQDFFFPYWELGVGIKKFVSIVMSWNFGLAAQVEVPTRG